MKRSDPITKEMIFTSSPEMAFKHAKLGKGPFKAGEAIIATDAKYSFWYAKYVLRGRFMLGEPAIYSDPRITKLYNSDVLNRDWVSEERERVNICRTFGLQEFSK